MGYAISASSLTWTVLKDVNGKSDSSSSSTSSSTSPATGEFIKPSIKEVETSLVYLDVCDGSVNDGEIHNTVINKRGKWLNFRCVMFVENCVGYGWDL